MRAGCSSGSHSRPWGRTIAKLRTLVGPEAGLRSGRLNTEVQAAGIPRCRPGDNSRPFMGQWQGPTRTDEPALLPKFFSDCKTMYFVDRMGNMERKMINFHFRYVYLPNAFMEFEPSNSTNFSFLQLNFNYLQRPNF